MNKPRKVKRWQVLFYIKDMPKLNINEEFCSDVELKGFIAAALDNLPAGLYFSKISVKEAGCLTSKTRSSRNSLEQN